MTDLLKYNSSTHPIVKLEDDWNNLLDHGLEKTASYIIRKNGSYYEAIKGSTNTNAGTIAFGGATSVGGATGTNFDAVLNACQHAITSGIIFIRNGTYTLTQFTPHSNISVIGESRQGTIISCAPSATTALIQNTLNATHGPLTEFRLENFTFEMNDVVGVKPIYLHTPRQCTLQNLTFQNSTGQVAVTSFADAEEGDGGITAADIAADGGVLNSVNNHYNDFYLYRMGGIFIFKGTGVTLGQSQICLCSANNIWGHSIYGTGISFQEWASGLRFTNVWIALIDPARSAVIWNDTATPNSNMGVYDCSFSTLWVDVFFCNYANTRLLNFNGWTKGNVVRNYFGAASTPSGTFNGVNIYENPAAAAGIVSYYVEQVNPGDNMNVNETDLYIKVYSKGYRYGTMITDNIAMMGEVGNTELYLAMNVAYRSGITPYITMRTLVGAVEREHKIVSYNTENALRIQTDGYLIADLGDNAGASKFRVENSDADNVFEIDSLGDTTVLDPNKGFILKDRTTAAFYRLKVDNGVLGIEGV